MAEELTFGSWLKKRRKELGLGQEELAERAGCSVVMLRKLESGERRPSGQVAQLLAEHLLVPAPDHQAFIAFARTGRAYAETALPAPAGRDSSSGEHFGRKGSASTTTLPAVLTTLIGRESDEERIMQMLRSPNVRLLTLTGAPGIGKTRLGLQVAADMLGDFEDGVFLVELASVADPDLVLPAVAQALGLRESEGSSMAEVLVDYTRKRNILLLLDNFEQVLDAAPAVVKLLESGPRVKALVTSREVLHVRGEQRFPVPPLGLPNASLVAALAEQQGDLGAAQTLQELAKLPSVRLFAERAQAAEPGFELSPENGRDVAEICSRLEGLPLAIELAAARVDHFSPAEMRAALSSRLKLLTGGARDLPMRQRTLKSAIEWSYNLLSAPEQEVLRRLSVFAGGCTVEAAEAVCMALGDVHAGMLDVLLALVDKHLLREVSTRARLNGQQEEQRFAMLEMIREFTSEKLFESEEISPVDGAREREAIERAYALYYAELAEKAVPRMRSADGAAWTNRLESEHDNVRAALRNLLDSGHNEQESARLALRLSAAMGPFWRSRGYFREGGEWLSQALEDAGSIAWDPADRERMSLQAQALNSAGWLAWVRGDLAGAGSYFADGLTLYREIGDRQGIAHLLNGLGQIALDRLNYEEAITAYQEALEIARQDNDRPLIARTLNNLGNTYRNMTDYAAALRCYEESLGLYRAMDDTSTMVTPLNNLGLVSTDLQDYDAARRYYGESLRLSRERGNREDLTFTLAFVGMLAVEEGDFDAASRIYAEALPMVRDMGYMLVLALCLEGVALMEQKLGRPLKAARLWGRAASIRDGMDLPLPVPSRARYEESVSVARSQSDPALFDSAWSQGAAMQVEEAVRYALQD